MIRFYDPLNNRLVYIKDKAGKRFWDAHWNRYSVRQQIKSAVLNRMILAPTQKYLHRGARILEGGCGLGQNVWSLHRAGYQVHGIDFAEETVRKVNKAAPELKVSRGDVRCLTFENDSFDGYWSLGVIEHFYYGYDDIVKEMKRILKPGGYLFLTFPSMSWFRTQKANRGCYKYWDETTDLQKSFYQFALSGKSVEEKIGGEGFKLISKKRIGGLKGLKDEIEYLPLKRLLQGIYDSDRLAIRLLAWGSDLLLSPYTGHGQLIIFKKV